MRRLLAVAVTSGLASLAVFGLAGTPAQAQTASHDSYTGLILTIADGERAWPADDAVSLWCDPPGGSHPEAADACAELASVDGAIAELPSQPMYCTYEYAPVTVTASGYWQGREVDYQETFPNRCVMLRETGPVFAF